MIREREGSKGIRFFIVFFFAAIFFFAVGFIVDKWFFAKEAPKSQAPSTEKEKKAEDKGQKKEEKKQKQEAGSQKTEDKKSLPKPQKEAVAKAEVKSKITKKEKIKEDA